MSSRRYDEEEASYLSHVYPHKNGEIPVLVIDIPRLKAGGGCQ